MRKIRLVRALAALITVIALSGLLLPASAFASPVLFCTTTVAGGTTTKVDLPTDCGGGSFGGTYNNLRIVFTVACDSAVADTSLRIRFNSDTANDYAYNYILSTSGGLTHGSAGTQSGGVIADLPCDSIAGRNGNMNVSGEVEIPGFNRTVFAKNVVSRAAGENPNLFTEEWSSLWSYGPAAITSIQLDVASGAHFLAGSHFDLYQE